MTVGPATEADLIPLSALQHYLFCPRQCALIHVEQAWAENALTAEGRVLHERVDAGRGETRKGVRIARGVAIRSLALGVSGIADVVEFHGRDRRPIPIEYKRGRPKAHRADEVQLCAQAICLEEMLGGTVAQGYLFYGKVRRRTEVRFDDRLRSLTQRVAEDAAAMIRDGISPPPIFEKRKCAACSLIDLCRPERMASQRSVSRWLDRALAD